MRTWIEIRQERHTLGNDDRDDWSYGSALWSPTTNKAGSKIYELMKEPIVGDRVLHFYETGGVRYYHAYSKIKEKYDFKFKESNKVVSLEMDEDITHKALTFYNKLSTFN